MSSKNHSLKLSLAHVYTIFHLHQNQIFNILPNVSFSPPSHASFYTLFVSTQGVHMLSLTVSSTLPNSLILSIFAFIAFVLMACSCTAIISDSVSLFILLSLSHSHFFSCNVFHLVNPNLSGSQIDFTLPSPSLTYWFLLNNSEMVKAVTLIFCGIQ